MEKIKKIILALSMLAAAAGFMDLADVLENINDSVEVYFTGISSLISVIIALYTKVKDSVTNKTVVE